MTQSYKNHCQRESVPCTLTSHLCAGSSVDLDLEAPHWRPLQSDVGASGGEVNSGQLVSLDGYPLLFFQINRKLESGPSPSWEVPSPLRDKRVQGGQESRGWLLWQPVAVALVKGHRHGYWGSWEHSLAQREGQMGSRTEALTMAEKTALPTSEVSGHKRCSPTSSQETSGLCTWFWKEEHSSLHKIGF